MKPFVSVPTCVSGFVTTTLTAPAPCAPVVVVKLVAEDSVTFVAVTPPSFTVAPTKKLVPVSVTTSPPSVEPEPGITLVTVGAAPVLNENPFVIVPVCPSGFVTTTLTTPSACNGTTAVIVVALSDVTVAAVPPIVTVAPLVKLVPAIVTDAPPAARSNAGAIDSVVGGGM